MAELRIISRAEVRMPYGDGVGTAIVPALEVWLHHSVTIAPDLVPPFTDDDEAIRVIARIGAERFGTAYGFPYTIGITPVGRIYAGHHPHKLGAHTGGRNSIARAIVLVGDYRTTKPTSDQIVAAAWALQEGKRRGWWRAAQLTGGHRQAPGAQTECPGNAAMAAIPEINRLAAGPPITPSMEDDMPLSDDDVAKLAERIRREVLDTPLVPGWSLADMAREWATGVTNLREAGQLTKMLTGDFDAEALAAKLDELDIGGASKADVIDAVRQVFASAGQAGTTPAGSGGGQ